MVPTIFEDANNLQRNYFIMLRMFDSTNHILSDSNLQHDIIMWWLIVATNQFWMLTVYFHSFLYLVHCTKQLDSVRLTQACPNYVAPAWYLNINSHMFRMQYGDS